MRIKTWFFRWWRALCDLLMLGTKPRKSEAQRKHEREKRLKKKHARAHALPLEKKKKTKKQARHQKGLQRIATFLLATLSILFLPLGIYRLTARHTRKRKAAQKPPALKSTENTPKPGTAKGEAYRVPICDTDSGAVAENTPKSQAPQSAPLAKDAPSSTPKAPFDRYIKKQMRFTAVPDISQELAVGEYIDLDIYKDPTNGKDTVQLLCRGKQIGVMDHADQTAFLICLRQGRGIYGVITQAPENTQDGTYVYECWFVGVERKTEQTHTT